MSSASVYSVFRKKSFSEVFSGIDVMYEYDFFLNCDSYQILLPKQPKVITELNIFEQTLLKILRIRPMMTTEELTDLTCLKPDFVSAVIISLIERGYLTENSCPTEKANELALSRDDTEKTGVRLFALRGTDRLISIVCWDESNIIQGEYVGGNIRASWGSVGTERSVFGQARSYKFDVPRRPSGESALTLLKAESKRLKRTNISNDTILKKPTLENSGSVFIHLKAIVQRGNVKEVLVSDGIWASNDDLVGYIRESDPGFFAEIIRKAASTPGNSQDKRTNLHTGKYRELKAIRAKTLNSSSALNKDDMNAARDHNLAAMKSLFDAVEWTLYYYVQNNMPDEQILGAFFSQRANDNMKLSMKAANNIGLFIGSNDAELFSRCDGQLLRRDLYSEQPIPNLDRLLPLCIFEASRNPQSGFHELIRINKGFLTVIKILRETAKKIRHADNTDDINAAILERMNQNVAEIIRLLLPDFDDGDSGGMTAKFFAGSSEKIAGAVASIVPDKLTYMEYGKLSEGCKGELLKIAPSLEGNAMLDAPDFVLAISRAAEILLREKISLLHIDEYLDKQDAVKVIESRLNARIPEGLAHVSDWYYSQAIAGKNSTLGAYALVMMGHAGQDKFSPEVIGEMLNFISELTSLRGHGNSVGLMISDEKLRGMREKLFTFIKLMEA